MTPRRLRVAMLGQYPPDPSRVGGGVGAVLAVLCGEMARHADVDLHVLCSIPSVGRRRSESRESFTVHWAPRHRWGRATFYRRDVGDLTERIRELDPDIVHAHGTGHYAAAAVAAGRPGTVITPHGIVFREARFAGRTRERAGWWMQALWERRILRGARHIIAISPYVERELQGRTPAAFHPIENPVSEGFFSVPPPDRAPRVLWVGRLIARKDPQTALRAFARVKSAVPESELRMVGESTTDRGYATETKALAAALGLSNAVHWLGELDHGAVLEEYRRCRLVVLSSLQETAPIVIAQAMAAARPVVTTSVGGCADMVASGETGLVVGPGDDVALADGMTRLISSPCLWEGMSLAARRGARERFLPRAVVDETLGLYRRLSAAGQEPCSGICGGENGAISLFRLPPGGTRT